MKYPSIIGSSDKKFRNYVYKQNTSGNYKKNTKARGTKIVPYTRTGAMKGKLRQFASKPIPKFAMGVAKFGIKRPILSTALIFAGGQLKKLGKTKSFTYPEYRQFDRKGRKI
jgi:hypothetical protein|tara:strand:- start:186 stop:521 length:336 start_codon:yes stop_codon:yes gene_type:complete